MNKENLTKSEITKLKKLINKNDSEVLSLEKRKEAYYMALLTGYLNISLERSKMIFIVSSGFLGFISFDFNKSISGEILISTILFMTCLFLTLIMFSVNADLCSKKLEEVNDKVETTSFLSYILRWLDSCITLCFGLAILSFIIYKLKIGG